MHNKYSTTTKHTILQLGLHSSLHIILRTHLSSIFYSNISNFKDRASSNSKPQYHQNITLLQSSLYSCKDHTSPKFPLYPIQTLLCSFKFITKKPNKINKLSRQNAANLPIQLMISIRTLDTFKNNQSINIFHHYHNLTRLILHPRTLN